MTCKCQSAKKWLSHCSASIPPPYYGSPLLCQGMTLALNAVLNTLESRGGDLCSVFCFLFSTLGNSSQVRFPWPTGPRSPVPALVTTTWAKSWKRSARRFFYFILEPFSRPPSISIHFAKQRNFWESIVQWIQPHSRIPESKRSKTLKLYTK